MMARVFLTGLLLGTAACGGSQPGSIVLLNVSYDPTRELYREVGEAYARASHARTGRAVELQNSHGGSGAQARAVLGGLKADLVTLALASDIEVLAEKGLVAADWASRAPNHACPYTSTIVLLVRSGNPKGIRGWDDLVREDVSVIAPNPKTSGGARWNFMAAWGHVTLRGGSEAEAADFIRRWLRRVPVLDTGARGSTTTFVQKGMGDVLVAWENEALLAVRESGPGKLEVVYPEDSILAEPPVAIVDANVDARGTRAAAEDFLKYLYSEEAQELIARSGYRPVQGTVLERHRSTFPALRKLFTIEQVAGSWKEAQKKFFVQGGVFDQLSGPRQ
ncbi:MAG TPA: sulfate ABC transporter substrate-binding protein [Planctomycetota bacterium]|nr:sulfate ABC transporter substrate-binding protein [Planctomycetota bacterium]